MIKEDFNEIEETKKQMKRQQLTSWNDINLQSSTTLKLKLKRNPKQLRTRMLLKNQKNLTQGHWKARHHQEN